MNTVFHLCISPQTSREEEGEHAVPSDLLHLSCEGGECPPLPCYHPDCAGQSSLFREQQGQRSVDHCLRDNYSGGGEHYFCRTRTHYPAMHLPSLPSLHTHTECMSLKILNGIHNHSQLENCCSPAKRSSLKTDLSMYTMVKVYFITYYMYVTQQIPFSYQYSMQKYNFILNRFTTASYSTLSLSKK